jgi:hypothetical protein
MGVVQGEEVPLLLAGEGLYFVNDCPIGSANAFH